MTDTMAIQDHLEETDITEPELLSKIRPVASSAPSAHPDRTDPMDRQDQLDQQDQRELQERQEQELARPEPPELRATPDRREPMVQLARLAHQALMEARVAREHQAKRVQPDQLAAQAKLVPQELTATMEVQENLDQLDQLDRLAELANLAHLDQLATLVCLAMMRSTARAHIDRLSSAASASVSVSRHSQTHESMSAYSIACHFPSLSSVVFERWPHFLLSS